MARATKNLEQLEIERETKALLNDAGKAIDEPWFVVRYAVRQMISQFKTLTGRAPRLIYIPKIVEAALEVDAARNLDQHTKLRASSILFGLTVCWDADELKVE